MPEIRLHDTTSNKKVTLQAQPTKEDIELLLPNESGTLITEKNLVSQLEKNKLDITSTPIIQPTIVNMIDNEMYDGWLEVSEYKTSDIFVGEHEDTEWEVSDDYDFYNIIDRSKPLVNKYRFKPTVNQPEKWIYVRCRFISGSMMSKWSNPKNYQMPKSGIRSPKYEIIDNDLTPTIKVLPLETYGEYPEPKLKKIKLELVDSDNFLVYKHEDEELTNTEYVVGHQILKPNTTYTFTLTVSIEGTEDYITYGMYTTPDFHVEIPKLEIIQENGRTIVRSTPFTAIGYTDEHYSTDWELLTEANHSLYKLSTTEHLRYFDISEHLVTGASHYVVCKYNGKKSVEGGKYFSTEPKKQLFEPIMTHVLTINGGLQEHGDHTATLTTDPLVVEGDLEDKYVKTVFIVSKSTEETKSEQLNRENVIFQVDTDDELFKTEEHNRNDTSTVVKIPETFFTRVSQAIGLSTPSQKAKYRLIVYKVSGKKRRTNSLIFDLENRYELPELNFDHNFNHFTPMVKAYATRVQPEISIHAVNIVPAVELVKGKGFSWNNIKELREFEIEKFINIDFGKDDKNVFYFDPKDFHLEIPFTYIVTVKTNRGNKRYLYPTVVKNYTHYYTMPIAEVLGTGLERSVSINKPSIVGRPKQTENTNINAYEVTVYNNASEVIWHEEKPIKNIEDGLIIPLQNTKRFNSTYHVVGRLFSNTSSSIPFKLEFQTENINISLGGVKGANGNIIRSTNPKFECYGYQVTGASGNGVDHISTSWRLIDPDGVTVWQVLEDMVNVKSITAFVELKDNTDYTLEATAHSRMFGKSNTVSSTIHYRHSVNRLELVDKLDSLLHGNAEGGVYGIVPKDLVAGRRIYVGTWGNEFEFRKSSSVGTGVAQHHDYQIGQRVSYNGKLYECLKTHPWKASRTPDIDTETWKLIDKDLKLPSPMEVLEALGIAYNTVEENNDPTEAYGVTKYWSDRSRLGNNDLTGDWIKMLSPTTRRVCYVINKTLINGLSYNDIISRCKEYGMVDKYTLRFGTRLYYVRLVTLEEEMELQKLPSNMGIDITKQVLVCNNVLGKDDNVYMVNYGKRGVIKVGERKGCLRIVITPISDDKAPHTMIPNTIPMPIDQTFNYDPFTDEGYFGYIKKSDFINTEDLFTELGLVDGIDVSSGVDYYHVYYQHGRIVYRPNKPLKAGLTYEDLRKAGVIYGTDMGTFHKNTKYYYNKDNKTCLFNLELLSSMNVNIVAKDERPNVANSKVYKTKDHLWFSNYGLFVNSDTNLMYRTLTPQYPYAGYGQYVATDPTGLFFIVGDSFTKSTTGMITKPEHLHIGTNNPDYVKNYPFNQNTASRIIAKNLVILKEGEKFITYPGIINNSEYRNSTYAMTTGEKSLYGWLPQFVLNI